MTTAFDLPVRPATGPVPVRLVGEAVGVFAVVFVGYFLLLSQLPVDDVPRYVNELGSNAFHWDLGHVWMQPFAMLLYRSVLGGLTVMRALETINVVAVALGAAILYDTLRRLDHRTTTALVATAFVVLSYNLIVLGPTGHIKLIVFPLLALSLRHATFWERDAAAGDVRLDTAFFSGLWLGIGSNFLVSILPSALFVALFILLRTRQGGRSGTALWSPAASFSVGVGLGGAVLLVAAYLTAAANDAPHATSIARFVFGGLREKEDLHIGFSSVGEMAFRFVYSLIYNFAFMPTLGSLGRAFMGGMAQPTAANAASLAWQAGLAALSLFAIGAIVVVAFLAWGDRRRHLLLPLGFVLGAATFSFYYNLNDPEHWFQFTLPIALIAVEARRRWLHRLVFVVWLPLFAIVNLGLYGIPKAAFDVPARERELAEALGPRGLGIGFGAYPGEPDTSLLGAGDAERFKLDVDLLYLSGGKLDAMYAHLDSALDAAAARGARVIVFRALDPDDWRGPVMFVAARGLTKSALASHLERKGYRIGPPIVVAGFPARELVADGARARP